jgi:hypothetical protein
LISRLKLKNSCNWFAGAIDYPINRIYLNPDFMRTKPNKKLGKGFITSDKIFLIKKNP